MTAWTNYSVNTRASCRLDACLFFSFFSDIIQAVPSSALVSTLFSLHALSFPHGRWQTYGLLSTHFSICPDNSMIPKQDLRFLSETIFSCSGKRHFLSSHDYPLIEHSCVQHTAGQAASIILHPVCLFERGSSQMDLHRLIVMHYQPSNKDCILLKVTFWTDFKNRSPT